jgi:nucleoside-diphosphate-sugar epimerase
MLTLVTGGSGYFGETVVRRLLERGDRVRVFDLVDNEERPSAVDFVRGDVRDPEAVRGAMRGVEIVHHNVAQVPLAKDRAKFWSVNVGGTQTVLEAAQREGLRKVICVSLERRLRSTGA